jgi:hypothetical protein
MQIDLFDMFLLFCGFWNESIKQNKQQTNTRAEPTNTRRRTHIETVGAQIGQWFGLPRRLTRSEINQPIMPNLRPDPPDSSIA